MRAFIESARVGTASAEKVSAANVRIGDMHIGRLALRDVHIDHPEGRIDLHGVRVVVELTVTVDVHVTVAGFTRTLHWNQGPLSMHLIQRDISVALPAGIRSLQADEISTLNLNATGSTIAPEQPLQLGRLVASAIVAAQLQTSSSPAATPDTDGTGASFDNLRLSRLRSAPTQSQDPALSANSVTIGTTSLNLPLPRVDIPGPSFQPGSIAPLRAGEVVLDGPAAERTWTDDDGHLRGQLRIAASGRLEINSLEVTLSATLGIGTIELTDLHLPLTIDQLTLADLGLSELEIDPIELR